MGRRIGRKLLTRLKPTLGCELKEEDWLRLDICTYLLGVLCFFLSLMN